jgi:hypothetical protein
MKILRQKPTEQRASRYLPTSAQPLREEVASSINRELTIYINNKLDRN